MGDIRHTCYMGYVTIFVMSYPNDGESHGEKNRE